MGVYSGVTRSLAWQLCSLRVALVSWESSETAGRLMTALGRFLIGEYREAEGQGR